MVIRTMTVIISLIFITIHQGAFVWKDYIDDYDNNDDDYTIIYFTYSSPTHVSSCVLSVLRTINQHPNHAQQHSRAANISYIC